MKYIVLCGGGPNCFSQLVMIKTLMDKDIIQYDKIEKIYGTSGGTIMGAFIALKLPLDEIIEYIIERPWNKMIKFDMDSLFNFNEKKGFYDYELFYKILSPIFSSNDIPIDITLNDVYNLTKIELRLMTTELDSFDIVELSYITHPNLKLIDAITMSCSFTPMFSPFIYDNKYYVDGGFINTYPIDIMMRDIIDDEHHLIIGINIRKIKNQIQEIKKNINEMNSIEFIQHIITKSLNKIKKINIQPIKYDLYYDADHLMCDYELFTLFINDINYRKSMKERSILIANDYLNSLFKNMFNVENNGLAS